MSIQFSLGIISSVDIHAVPVSVGDGAAIFHYDGQLVGEFYNIKDDTVIQWSQVSGIPVTFTSPLDEETITFTSNDLDKKVFKCCTNPGTDAELCALAEFYHFPVDWSNKMDVFDNKASSIYDPNTLTLADFDAFNFQAMVPVDSSLDGFDNIIQLEGMIAEVGGTINQYTEQVIKYSGLSDMEQHIRSVKLLENDGSGWNIVSETKGIVGVTIDIPPSVHERQFVFHVVRYGMEYYLTLPVSTVPDGGVTQTHPFTEQRRTTLSSINTLLSKIVTSSYEEGSPIVTVEKRLSVSHVETILQVLVQGPTSEDSSPVSTGKTSIANVIATTLQTSVGVT